MMKYEHVKSFLVEFSLVILPRTICLIKLTMEPQLRNRDRVIMKVPNNCFGHIVYHVMLSTLSTNAVTVAFNEESFRVMLQSKK